MSVRKIVVNTVIIGGGHAGCNLACWLQEAAAAAAAAGSTPRSYVVLERNPTALHRWRAGRWTDFQLNTPVKYSRLHAQEDDRDDQLLDRPLADDLSRWDAHLEKMGVKVRCNTSVTRVCKLSSVEARGGDGAGDAESPCFATTAVDTSLGEQLLFESRNVVVCSGAYNDEKVPRDLAAKLPATIKQHTPVGFDAGGLGSGALLIVGGGQTGYQIADLLLDNKCSDSTSRDIYICVSASGGAPRTLRGRDLFYWLEEMKFLSIPQEALAGMPPPVAASLRYSHPPVTGPNKAISPFSCYRKGAKLLGRLIDVKVTANAGGDGNSDTPAAAGRVAIVLAPDRAKCLNALVLSYTGIAAKIDGFINEWVTKNGGEEATGVPLESDMPEPEWQDPEKELLNETGPLEVDATAAGITDVLWATGYSANLSFLEGLPEVAAEYDEKTHLPQHLESPSTPGLFFLGFPWLGTQQSQNLVGFDADQAVIMQRLR